MQGKTVLLRAKPTQASALTHDSNLSEKSLGKEQCVTYGFGALWMLHFMASLWQHVGNEAGDCGEGFWMF